jgi:tRNA A37 threonylcarbamoyladenosine dehydratase
LPLVPEKNNDISEEGVIDRAKQKQVIGSISYLPAVMGLMAASYVIRDILKD